jgi:hypothetical protein
MKTPRLVFCLVTLTGIALSPSCGLGECDDDETERDTACDQVTRAAESASATCGVALASIGALCSLNCVRSSRDGRYCRSDAEVEACLRTIQSMGCAELSRTAILANESCKRLIDRMENDCVKARSSGSDDDDWDD